MNLYFKLINQEMNFTYTLGRLKVTNYGDPKWATIEIKNEDGRFDASISEQADELIAFLETVTDALKLGLKGKSFATKE